MNTAVPYTISDAELRRIERMLLTAEQRVMRDLAESIYGQGVEARVYELRRSILGDEAGPPYVEIQGLAAAVKSHRGE